MKNITVSVDDDIYRNARRKAAELNTSVSRLVAEYLEEIATEDDRIAESRKRMEELFSQIDTRGFRFDPRVSRDEVHER